jgi:hypothetical protein
MFCSLFRTSSSNFSADFRLIVLSYVEPDMPYIGWNVYFVLLLKEDISIA